ncbi:putative endo-polygalacturonase [Helianthus annuus]|nr:putative endo-polygalacturonase [Helianthus annuus]
MTPRYAFVKAWGDLCGDTSADPTLIIPSGKTFLIQCVSFVGPCKSSSVHIQLLGDITAPKTLDGWKGCDTKGYLIYFALVQGLIVDGPGQIDGQGSIWWPGGGEIKTFEMLRFEKCDGLQLRGTRHINSPKSHVSLTGCKGADIGSLHISAPKYSPNTDGIGISWSLHVNIHDSVIQSGDDCVGIGGGVYDINVTSVLVWTWSWHKYGKGYARSIVFEDIHLTDVNNPIIIDQHYCTNMNNEDCPAPPNASSVHVSDVTYRNIHGSSASKQAIAFNCVGRFNCTGIITNEVEITGEDVSAYCHNVEGDFIQTTPQITCN